MKGDYIGATFSAVVNRRLLSPQIIKAQLVATLAAFFPPTTNEAHEVDHGLKLELI